MGLFSSSYKYEAYAGSSGLFDDNPNTLIKGIVESAIADTSLSTSVQFSLATDLTSRGKKAVKYAQKPDGYVRGLPTSDQKSLTISGEILLTEIEKEVGEPLEDLYWMIIGRPQETFHVAMHLQEEYPNFAWGTPPDNPVWAEEREFVEIPVINSDTGKYYIVDNLPIYSRIGDPGTSESYYISFAYTDNTGTPAIWEMPGTLDLTNLDSDWIQGKYHTQADEDTTRYYVYRIGSNENPAIEASIIETENNSAYMPVAIMMQDKVWYDGDYDYDLPPESRPEKTPLHATTDKLLKYFSVKGREIKENYIEQTEEDGDQAGEAWDFFIHFAIPIQSNVRGSREYLYEFFLEMEKNQQYSFEQYQQFLTTAVPKEKEGYRSPQPISELNISEGDVNGYNVKYGWSYIYSETFPGQFVQPNGELLRPNRLHADGVQRTKVISSSYKQYLEEMHGPGILYGKWNDPDNDKARDDANGYHDFYIVTKQHWDIETDTYTHTRVIVMGLSMLYTINTKETDSGKNGYRFRYADMGMFNFNDEGERTEEFRIPIHIGIFDRVARVHREEALADGMCATVQLVDKIKVKWYQKAFFKWLIVIIAIILIVLSFIFGPLPALAAQALLGVASGLVYIMVVVILSFAMGMIIALASQTISEEFGATAGTLFTIIATIASMGGSAAFNTAGMSAFGSAAHLLTTVATYANMAVQVYSTYTLENLQDEMRHFMMTAREKQEELADAWDNIGERAGGLDPLDLKRALEVGMAEQPSSYYARTLNANPGLLGYDLINNFPEIARRLPEYPGDANIVESQFDTFERQRGMV